MVVGAGFGLSFCLSRNKSKPDVSFFGETVRGCEGRLGLSVEPCGCFVESGRSPPPTWSNKDGSDDKRYKMRLEGVRPFSQDVNSM